MSDEEIIAALKSGEALHYGCNARNLDIMNLMARLEQEGLIETEDMGLTQETRRVAKWKGIKP